MQVKSVFGGEESSEVSAHGSQISSDASWTLDSEEENSLHEDLSMDEDGKKRFDSTNRLPICLISLSCHEFF